MLVCSFSSMVCVNFETSFGCFHLELQYIEVRDFSLVLDNNERLAQVNLKP